MVRSGVTEGRAHRGPHPKDAKFFSARAQSTLREATSDLCWLLSRDYALHSASELVGNRYELSRRQRMAVSRCSCSRQNLESRRQREVQPADLHGEELWLDGYNVLTAVEVALGGGMVLIGCDGCCRDVAGIHRRYRKVEETAPALRLVGEVTAQWRVHRCRWWLDSPVANTGRLKTIILQVAAAGGWNWDVELVFNPDRVLAQSDRIVATADSVILDRCRRWVNLSRRVMLQGVPHAHWVDLGSVQE